ncbi:nitrate reductase cytochrome c-type subunit [Atopomonas sediminilitoris]|uniref:nitrate reductase cytochrome c-type subunit n=1 Tax=Atopomonas sediminilitoris TaxID=2919919 RepID=UPI0035218625
MGLMAWGAVAASLDAPAPDGRRPGGTIAQETQAEPIPKIENKDLKRLRNYPEQPPTIPHKIDGYQVNTQSNKCLSCHSRTNSAKAQAPMISITHYMDRDGQPLATVSPRRYFCEQCHVPQHETPAAIPNTFKDIDKVLEESAAKP